MLKNEAAVKAATKQYIATLKALGVKVDEVAFYQDGGRDLAKAAAMDRLAEITEDRELRAYYVQKAKELRAS